jgi:type IX secretion system PorP/SprF family membrane protein
MRISLTVIIFLAVNSAWGQISGGEQYYINLPARNPAFTGIDNLLDIHLRYRKTSSQLGSNPSNLGFSVFGKFGKAGSGVYRNNSFRVSDPGMYPAESSFISRKHGLGLTVNSFKLNGYDRKSVGLNYAYHIPVHARWAVSLGTSVNLLTERFNVDDLTVRDPINDQFYQSVMTNGTGTVGSYSLAFGGALYSENFFVGLGANTIMNSHFSNGNLTPVPAKPEFYLVSGKTMKVNSLLSIQPTVQLSHDDMYGDRIGAGVRVRYKTSVWAGIHYENAQKISYLFGLNIQSKLRVYYAYDQFINDLKELRAGNHEVIIRIPLLNKHSLNTYTW